MAIQWSGLGPELTLAAARRRHASDHASGGFFGSVFGVDRAGQDDLAELHRRSAAVVASLIRQRPGRLVGRILRPLQLSRRLFWKVASAAA
jgi:hypothetical protein